MGTGGVCAENPCPLHQEWAIEAGRIKTLFAETRLDMLAGAVKEAACPCPLAPDCTSSLMAVRHHTHAGFKCCVLV